MGAVVVGEFTSCIRSPPGCTHSFREIFLLWKYFTVYLMLDCFAFLAVKYLDSHKHLKNTKIKRGTGDKIKNNDKNSRKRQIASRYQRFH